MSEKKVSAVQTRVRSDDVTVRLRRVEGQVAGICRMEREGRPCAEILDQIAAARAALEATAVLVLRHRIEALIREGRAVGDIDGSPDRVVETVVHLLRSV